MMALQGGGGQSDEEEEQEEEPELMQIISYRLDSKRRHSDLSRFDSGATAA